MNNVLETIKNAFVGQFTAQVTVPMIVFSLICACVIGIFIVVVYKKTFQGVVFNRGIVLAIVLLTMITAIVIRTINSNLALSLGMVGALSIIRFRTVIKEPVDTAFMFWGIAEGIMSGVGLYAIAIVSAIVLGILYYLIYVYGSKAKAQYLLVINCQSETVSEAENFVSKLSKKKLRSRSSNDKGMTELTYEVEYSKDASDLIKSIQEIQGVKNVNLITYQNEFGL